MDQQMSAREVLASRRQQIIAINEIQRQSMVIQVQMWRSQIQTLGLALNLLGRLRDNPLLAGALALGVVVLKPSRINTAIKQTSLLWQRVSLFLPLLFAFLRRDKAK